MYERIGFGLYQSCGNRGSVVRMSMFGLRWCGWCGWGVGVGRGFDQGMEGWGGVFFVYMAGPSAPCVFILLHLIDIFFLPCICLWHISQIQTCLCVVVGPGFVSTSPLL